MALKHILPTDCAGIDVGVGKEGCALVDPWGYPNRKLPFIELL